MTNDAGVPGAPRFDVVLRGYDRRQVDEHVDRLQRVLSRMRADLEIVRSQPMPAVTPAPRPADGPRPRPTPRPRSGPPAPPDTIGNFTDRMESILAEAEAEAAEIRRNAHGVARAETDGVRAQVADLVRQRDSVLGELTRMRAQLEGMLAAPTAQMAAYEPAARPPVGPGPQGDAEQAAALAPGPSVRAEPATAVPAVVPPSVRPEREAGKAAHRLPTGAYPAVTEQSSSRPRTEPGIEPADLFQPRSADSRPAEPRTTAVPQQPAPEKPVVGPEERSTEKSGGVDTTTVVGSVRPEDARPVPQDNGSDRSRRFGSSSRSA